MFGLTFEKLFVLALIAGLVLGPDRLTRYTRVLADSLRSLRGHLDASRQRATDELGPLRLAGDGWDPRHYDPRVIMREALASDTPPNASTPIAPVTAPASPWIDPADVARIRPGQRYLVVGSAAHPKRLLLASLPADDPRRIAATTGDATPVQPRSGDDVALAAQAD